MNQMRIKITDLCIFLGLIMPFLCFKLHARLINCGISAENSIKIYDNSGEQLIGPEWACQLYFGNLNELEHEFERLPGVMTAQAFRVYPFLNYHIDSGPTNFFQFQLRFWNTNSGPTWEAAVNRAECDTNHLTAMTTIIQLQPWAGQCSCGFGSCPWVSLVEWGYGPPIVLQPRPPVLRIRQMRVSEGLMFTICNRGISVISVESSQDLIDWKTVPGLAMVSVDAVLVPDDPGRPTSFFRIRRVSDKSVQQ